MSLLPALLAAAALAAAPSRPAKPRPPSALDGCDATPVEHGWQYDCKDVRARLEDRPEVGDEIVKHLTGRMTAAAAMVGEGAKTRMEKRLLGAGQQDVLVTEAPGQTDALYHAAFPLGGGTRVIVCHGEDRRCAPVLSGLAAMFWRSENARGSIRKDAAPLAIAGRPVKAPDGCETTTQPRGGIVVCGKTDWVIWVTVGEQQAARRLAEEFAAKTLKTLERPGWKNDRDEVPCLLAGEEATCARVVVRSGDDALTVLWAIAPAGEGFAFANCMGRGAGGIGSPCSLLFAAR